MLQNENIISLQINYKFLFNVIPDPVIIIDKTGNIIEMNLSAADEFPELKTEDKFELLFADKRKIRNTLIELLQFHKVITDRAILHTKNNCINPFEFKATILSESNDLYLFIFNNLNTKNDILKLEIEHAFSAEINSLKPYLNKTGKELVEKKIESNALLQIFENETKLHSPEAFTEKQIVQKLGKAFPAFSINELKIAYFLSIGAGINQISSITDKNSNSLRVMIHRMSSKTQTHTTAELTKIINEAIQKDQ